MVWDPSPDEIRAISSCESAKRYEYLVKKLCDEEVLFSLWSDGWLLAADDAGTIHFPVWPHPTYAELCAEGEWESGRARAIALSEWLEKWTSGLNADDRMIAAFPTKTNRGLSITPLRFQNDLKLELDNY